MITRIVTPNTSLLDDYLFQKFPRVQNEVNYSAKYNIKETNDDFHLELAVPGFNKEDFQIKIEDNHLIIKVDKDITDEQQYLQKEFGRYGFEKNFKLSDKINAENIKASYESGILNISLPKKDEARVKPPKLIEIK